METAAGLLRAQGLRMTPQRLAIVQEIMTTEGYIVPVEVVARVQAKVPGVSAATVYRTLERLEQLGLLTHVHLESGVGYHRVDGIRHAHLTCSGCGVDLELSRNSLHDLEQAVQRAITDSGLTSPTTPFPGYAPTVRSLVTPPVTDALAF